MGLQAKNPPQAAPRSASPEKGVVNRAPDIPGIQLKNPLGATIQLGLGGLVWSPLCGLMVGSDGVSSPLFVVKTGHVPRAIEGLPSGPETSLHVGPSISPTGRVPAKKRLDPFLTLPLVPAQQAA